MINFHTFCCSAYNYILGKLLLFNFYFIFFIFWSQINSFLYSLFLNNSINFFIFLTLFISSIINQKLINFLVHKAIITIHKHFFFLSSNSTSSMHSSASSSIINYSILPQIHPHFFFINLLCMFCCCKFNTVIQRVWLLIKGTSNYQKNKIEHLKLYFWDKKWGWWRAIF